MFPVHQVNRQKGSYQYLDGQKIETYFEFDPNGNTVAAVDPRGHATYYSYDEADRLVATTDPLGETSSYEHDLNGNLVKSVDAEGVAAYFAYDAGRTTRRSPPQTPSSVYRLAGAG